MNEDRQLLGPTCKALLEQHHADHLRTSSGDTVEPLVLPNRFRLSFACLFLAVATLFDPSIVRGMLIAWSKDERIRDKINKAHDLCMQNQGVRQ